MTNAAASTRRPSAAPIVPFEPAPVGTGADALDPVEVVQVPAHRLPQTRLEVVARHPSEVVFDARAIHRVSAIVPRTILHEGDQLAILLEVAFLLGRERLEE